VHQNATAVTDSNIEPAVQNESSWPRRVWRSPLLWVSLVLNAVLGGLLWANDDSSTVGDTQTAGPEVTIAPTVTVGEPPPETDDPAEGLADVAATEDIAQAPVRVLVAGDSVASQIGWALHGWSEANPGHFVVFNESHIGCGVVRYGEKRVDGESGPVGDICSNWNDTVALHEAALPEIVSWPTAIEMFQPDVVLSIVSSWDATDRTVPGVVDEWTSIGDPVYDDYVLSEYTEATAVLSATGADVFWLMSPYLNRESLAEDHRERVDGINALVGQAIAAVVAENPDASVTQVDYPGWFGPIGGARDAELRDDGVHLSDVGQAEVAPWLVEEMGLAEAVASP